MHEVCRPLADGRVSARETVCRVGLWHNGGGPRRGAAAVLALRSVGVEDGLAQRRVASAVSAVPPVPRAGTAGLRKTRFLLEALFRTRCEPHGVRTRNRPRLDWCPQRRRMDFVASEEGLRELFGRIFVRNDRNKRVMHFSPAQKTLHRSGTALHRRLVRKYPAVEESSEEAPGPKAR